MKTKIKYLLVLVLASFVFAGCATSHCVSSKTTEWEYKVAHIPIKHSDIQIEVELDSASKGGWKLVTVVADKDPNYLEYIFERPKH